jgi:hypothetical protein
VVAANLWPHDRLRGGTFAACGRLSKSEENAPGRGWPGWRHRPQRHLRHPLHRRSRRPCHRLPSRPPHQQGRRLAPGRDKRFESEAVAAMRIGPDDRSVSHNGSSGSRACEKHRRTFGAIKAHGRNRHTRKYLPCAHDLAGDNEANCRNECHNKQIPPPSFMVKSEPPPWPFARRQALSVFWPRNVKHANVQYG